MLAVADQHRLDDAAVAMLHGAAIARHRHLTLAGGGGVQPGERGPAQPDDEEHYGDDRTQPDRAAR